MKNNEHDGRLSLTAAAREGLDDFQADLLLVE